MAANWTYDEVDGRGPSNWPKFYPIAKGKRQSPIDIKTDNVKYDAALKPVTVSYPTFHKASLTNTGKSVLFTPEAEEENDSELKGGPLSHKYKLAQFHFHWGSTNNTGSEHRVDGKMYDAELHLVHWNTELYKDVGTALNSTDGLCVLGIFLKVNDAAKDHEGLKDITDLLPNLTKKDKKEMLTKPFNPKSLLPDINQYWTYPGSLTTPPLYESVTWVVFKEPIEISTAQMEALRGLRNADDKPMAGNYRAPCDMHGRTVSASFA